MKDIMKFALALMVFFALSFLQGMSIRLISDGHAFFGFLVALPSCLALLYAAFSFVDYATSSKED